MTDVTVNGNIDTCENGDFNCFKSTLVARGFQPWQIVKENYQFSPYDAYIWKDASMTSRVYVELKTRTFNPVPEPNVYLPIIIGVDKVQRIHEIARQENTSAWIVEMLPFSTNSMYIYDTRFIVKKCDCCWKMANRNTMRSRNDKVEKMMYNLPPDVRYNPLAFKEGDFVVYQGLSYNFLGAREWLQKIYVNKF